MLLKKDPLINFLIILANHELILNNHELILIIMNKKIKRKERKYLELVYVGCLLRHAESMKMSDLSFY